MKSTITTFPVDHISLVASLKKAGILGAAIVDIPDSIPKFNIHLYNTRRKALCLRPDGKAYILRNWNYDAILASLEQGIAQGSTQIRIKK